MKKIDGISFYGGDTMFLESWPAPIHQSLDGIKRIKSATKINPDSFTINSDGLSALFCGSSPFPYEVTQFSCTCRDFVRRQLPCKHMYRLSIELGVEFSLPQFDPYAASEYDVEEDISRLKSRWTSGQLTDEAFIKCAEALYDSSSKAKRRRGRPSKK